jgi:Flp pilus assembly protein TadG
MRIANSIRRVLNYLSDCLRDSAGSQIAEFAVCVPLLTVFAVGIFDFSGAFNIRQKLGGAAQEGAVTAANEPTYDLDQANPASVQAIEKAVFVYLENENVLPNAILGTFGCGSGVPAPAHASTTLIWTYTTTGCPGTLVITIDRGCVIDTSDNTCGTTSSPGGAENVVYSHITVSYPYTLRFNNVIQLVGGSSASSLTLTSDAYAANQS